MHRDFDPKSPQYRRFTQVITGQVPWLCTWSRSTLMPIVMWLPTWRHWCHMLANSQPIATEHGHHKPFHAVFATALQPCDGSWACCVALQQIRGPKQPLRLSFCSSCLH